MNNFINTLRTPVKGYKTFNEFTTRFTLQIVLTVGVSTVIFQIFPDILEGGFNMQSLLVMVIASAVFTLYALFKDKQRFIVKQEKAKQNIGVNRK